MIIRQECLFSFEEIMKNQKRKETRLEIVLKGIDTNRLMRILGRRPRKGPEGYGEASLFLGLIAMRVMGIRYMAELVRQLEMNPVLRWLCGFGVMGRVPSEATYSRFVTKISKNEAATRLFNEMDIEVAASLPCEKIAVDGSAVEGRENPFAPAARRKKATPADPERPSWGVKTGTKVSMGKSHWYGWKLHLAVDADTGLPLCFEVTTGSVHEMALARNLCKAVHARAQGKPKYFLFDKGYDTEEIHRAIREELGATPLIPLQLRRMPTPAPDLDKQCAPVCSLGYSMTYWGFDGQYHKFRCPHMCGAVRCPAPGGPAWCSDSPYGLVVKQNAAEDPRKFGAPHRCSRKWAQLYGNRRHVERCFSLLKNFCSLSLIPHRGREKATAFIALSLVVLLSSVSSLVPV